MPPSIKIKTFLCPSDGETRGQYTLFGYLYANTGDGGSSLDYYYYWPTDYGQGKSNYQGVMGTNGPYGSTSSSRYGPGANIRPYCGIFYGRSKTRLVTITDGTSNTLMFGEGFGGSEASGSRDFMWNWISAGAMPTRKGLTNDPKKAGVNVFSSRHTGIVQFANADGSVRGVRPGATMLGNPASSDWYVLQAMAGMADGVVYDPSALGN